ACRQRLGIVVDAAIEVEDHHRAFAGAHLAGDEHQRQPAYFAHAKGAVMAIDGLHRQTQGVAIKSQRPLELADEKNDGADLAVLEHGSSPFVYPAWSLPPGPGL